MEIAVSNNKPIHWYCKRVLWESMVGGEDRVVISVIKKYEKIAEYLIITLNMWGFEMEKLENNPYEIVTKGKFIPLTLIKYSLILNPMIIAIRDELLKDKKSKNLLMYFLDNIEKSKMLDDKIDDELLQNANLKKLCPIYKELFSDRLEEKKKEMDSLCQ